MCVRFVVCCFMVLAGNTTVVYGETNTNDVVQLIRESLPCNLKLREFGPVSQERNFGSFGAVKYTYFFIYLRDSKKIYINEQADAYIYLLPRSYTYQSEDIRLKYENTYIGETPVYKLFLVTDGKNFDIFNVLKNNIKKRLLNGNGMIFRNVTNEVLRSAKEN